MVLLEEVNDELLLILRKGRDDPGGCPPPSWCVFLSLPSLPSIRFRFQFRDPVSGSSRFLFMAGVNGEDLPAVPAPLLLVMVVVQDGGPSNVLAFSVAKLGLLSSFCRCSNVSSITQTRMKLLPRPSFIYYLPTVCAVSERNAAPVNPQTPGCAVIKRDKTATIHPDLP